MKCAICGSENVTRSRLRGNEKIQRYIFFKKPYRCKECWSRFWVFENPLKSRSVKIAGGCLACLLILISVWHFRPRKEETSWHAVQRNVSAVPQSRTESRPEIEKNVQDKEENVKKQESGVKKPAASPEPEKNILSEEDYGTPEEVLETGESAEAIPSRMQAELPAKASESGDKPHESEKIALDMAGIRENRTNADKGGSVPVLPKPVRAEAADADKISDQAGSENVKNSVSEVRQKIRARHTEKPADFARDMAERIGKEETEPAVTDSATVSAPAEPAPAAAKTASVRIAPVKMVSDSAAPGEQASAGKKVQEEQHFRELKTVRTESGKDSFTAYIMADGPVRQYDSLAIESENPPKFAVDLPGKWKNSGSYIFPVKDDIAIRVRIGLHKNSKLGSHKNFARVVFDLKVSPVKAVFSETEQGLKVVISPNSQ